LPSGQSGCEHCGNKQQRCNSSCKRDAWCVHGVPPDFRVPPRDCVAL
jgi:hypothetical protein